MGLQISDSAPYHVYPPGKPFEIVLHNAGSYVVDVQWVDEQGNPLTTRTTLRPGAKLGLRSPSGAVGYYGLRSFDARGQRESGFAILPERATSARLGRPVKQSSPFGMVHSDNEDPYMDHWTKTATWETYGAQHWGAEMQRRRDLGMTELPLISGGLWETPADTLISEDRLAQLRRALMSYFRADPVVDYWEMGLEENLTPEFRQPHYWENLEAKMHAAHTAADEVNPSIRFVYQIAGTNLNDVEAFLSHPVSEKFSVLSLHPYHWPEFEDPDEWLPGYLAGVRELQEKYQSNHALWFTEAGAPQHLNPEGGRFNFGEARNVRGHSRGEALSYMTKLVTIALHASVEKIFWYNYRDRGNLSADPENFFGLRDFEGFPKPTYLAWHWLSKTLHNARPEKSLTLSSRIHTYRFTRRADLCAVAWASEGREYDVEVVSLLGKQSKVVVARSMTGRPLNMSAGTVSIGKMPIMVCALAKSSASSAKESS